MSGKFQQKSSSLMLSVLIGLIIVSFMFTGYQSMQGTPDTIAKVGNESIKIAEYQNEYNRLVQTYSNYMFGGKPLSSEQIKNFRIKDNALKSVVNGKLMEIFSERIGLHPGPEQVKDTIKELPYFKTNDQFDVTRYKMLLSSNRLSPKDFEDNTRSNIKKQELQTLINTFPVSSSYVTEILDIKNKAYKVSIVQFKKDSLTDHLKVTKKQIDEYLKSPENLQRVTSIFKSRKSKFDQKEQVKVKHILLSTQSKDKKAEDVKKTADDLRKKITKSNFSRLAKKHSDDPGSKVKGGDLDWFSQGRMVPEFEKAAFGGKKGTITQPVKSQYGYHIIYIEDKKPAKEAKLAEHQRDLAKELIQKANKDGLKKLVEEKTAEWEKLVKTRNHKKLDRLKDKFSYKYGKDVTFNRLDGIANGFNLKKDQQEKVFKEYESNEGKTYTFDDVIDVTILRVSKVKPEKLDEKKKKEKDDAEKRANVTNLSRTLNQEILKMMEEKTKVKVYGNFL